MGINPIPDLSPGMWVVIVALVLIEIVLLGAALIDLLRRTDEQVVGGKRWIWLLVCLFFNGIGPIIYFIVGRVRPPVADPLADVPHDSSGDRDRAQATVDLLYGDDNDPDSGGR